MYLSICGQCNAGSIPVMDLPTGYTLCVLYIHPFVVNLQLCKVSSILIMDLPTGIQYEKDSLIQKTKSFACDISHFYKYFPIVIYPFVVNLHWFDSSNGFAYGLYIMYDI